MNMRDFISLVESTAPYPQSVTPDFLVQLMLKIHYNVSDMEEGDLNFRIWKYTRYELRELPVADLHTPWRIDPDNVSEYAERMKAGEVPPPIIWDMVDDEPIDGGHRIEAAKLAGVATLPAYVGLPENVDPDYDDEQLEESVDSPQHHVATDMLPPDVRSEAEHTIPDDFYPEGDLVWKLTDINVDEFCAEWDRVNELNWDQKEYRYCEKLGQDMLKNGQQQPLVIGPGGMEGNHRMLAAHIAGIPTLKAWVFEIVDGELNEQQEATGDCYKAAYRLAVSNGGEVVHGEVYQDGKVFGHAWVEKDGMAIDNSNGNMVELPVEEYYQRTGVLHHTVHRYPVDDARRFGVRAKHFGPWD